MKTVVCQLKDPEFSVYFPTVSNTTPYLKEGVVVTCDDVVKGSLCIYDNPGLLLYGEPVLLIGDFLCEDDKTVAAALFSAAEAIAKTKGKAYLLGPMNGSVWNDYRLPISGNGPLFTGDLAQPLYYADLFCRNGFTTIHRYHSYFSAIPEEDSIITFPPDITVGNIDLEHFEEDLAGLCELSNSAFLNNPFFTPVDKEAFIGKYTQMLPLVDKRLTLVARKKQVPAAFLFSYRDPRQPDTLVIKTAAKHPDYELPGLMTNMARLLFRNIAGMGFTRAIHAFMHEENRSLLRSREFGGTILRSYALLSKKI